MKAFYNEIDKDAAQWLRNLGAEGWIMPGHVEETPIEKLTTDQLAGFQRIHLFAGIGGWDYALKLADWPEEWPVWTGSCPCQPFSDAGKRQGVKDPRHLWPAFRNLVAQHNPAIIFGEQVASKAGREWLAGVRTDLEAMGYEVGAADLCAAGVNKPHIRQRLFWVAHSKRRGYAGRIFRQRNQKSKQFAENSWKTVRAEDGRQARYGGSPFPLLGNGIPRDMAIVRGFGNAIVPQIAAIFIESVMDYLKERPNGE